MNINTFPFQPEIIAALDNVMKEVPGVHVHMENGCLCLETPYAPLYTVEAMCIVPEGHEEFSALPRWNGAQKLRWYDYSEQSASCALWEAWESQMEDEENLRLFLVETGSNGDYWYSVELAEDLHSECDRIFALEKVPYKKVQEVRELLHEKWMTEQESNALLAKTSRILAS